MKQTFVYSDEKSNKFWSIETADNCFTVTFGKVGTAGQTKEKSFADEAACQKEADKLIAEKVKKGYVKQGEGSGDKDADSADDSYLEEWEKIVNAADRPQALTEHFKYLADTPEQEETLLDLLRQIMNKCTDVKMEDDSLVMIFDDDNEIIAYAPLTGINPEYPQTFQAILRKHNHIHWEDYMFDLCGEIYVDNIGLQDDDLAEHGIKSDCDLTGCIWDYSDCWFFHPDKKNKYGEPQLVFLDHEGGDPTLHHINVGSAFIYRWAENLDIDVDFNKYEGD
ncbi:MAG: WGR domain-containing protein [Gracilibacteraceae bacterium]|jgi:predicted DNA-binding WGR domain protein|nr:WGR domain-containing protein [Gracilibacteraceae bacterium]